MRFKALPPVYRNTVRVTVDTIVREYLRDHSDDEPSPEQVDSLKTWEAIQKRTKTIEALCQMFRHTDAEWLRRLADELSNVPAKAKANVVLCKPRGRKEQFYSDLIRVWTGAGGPLHVSATGPLTRFLCSVVPFKLSEEGAKRAIQRERDRRKALAVVGALIGGQANVSIDEEKIYLVDRFSNRKP